MPLVSSGLGPGLISLSLLIVYRFNDTKIIKKIIPSTNIIAEVIFHVFSVSFLRLAILKLYCSKSIS